MIHWIICFSRLTLHTAAYWLLWAVRRAIPDRAALGHAEFTTLQRRLVKIGARVVETATRIRIAFASACPDKILFAEVLRHLMDRPAQRQQAP